MKKEIAFGFHDLSVIAKTSPERITCVYLLNARHDQRAKKLLSACERQNIRVQLVDKSELDAICDGSHQGAVAELKPGKTFNEADLYRLVQECETSPLVLVLDGVTDPHNLGACLRTADAAGAHALVVPKDNSASLNETARKVASGAAETVPLIAVTNLARSIKKLQELGLWVTGTAGEATQDVFAADLKGPRVIVMGAEGKGMRRLTRECCDELVKIPMKGEVSSLNVSVATGVILFETVRQNQQ